MRLWLPALGASSGDSGETRHEPDLPLCCRSEAVRIGAEAGYFECGGCGAAWQTPLPVEPEFDAFTYLTYRVADETEGAA